MLRVPISGAVRYFSIVCGFSARSEETSKSVSALLAAGKGVVTQHDATACALNLLYFARPGE
jgi:hypothetical protein